jgi:hypothetical protein
MYAHVTLMPALQKEKDGGPRGGEGDSQTCKNRSSVLGNHQQPGDRGKQLHNTP